MKELRLRGWYGLNVPPSSQKSRWWKFNPKQQYWEVWPDGKFLGHESCTLMNSLMPIIKGLEDMGLSFCSLLPSLCHSVMG
jgi:hypothetical protein